MSGMIALYLLFRCVTGRRSGRSAYPAAARSSVAYGDQLNMTALSAAIGIVLALLLPLETSAADDCQPIAHTCSGGAETRIVDGFEYTPSSCWDRSVLLNCERNPPYDSCAPLEAAPSCVELSTSCVDYREGACAKYEKRFSCQNASVDETELTVIDASYTITNEGIANQCGALEAEANCVYQGEVCTEGPETRLINGMPVTKNCWAWERTYSCPAGEITSDCDELESDPSCQKLDEVCLKTLPDGSCGHWETNFKCGGSGGSFDPKGGDPNCGAVEVCVAGDCRTYEDEPNKDFGKAAAYLNMVDAIAKDFEDFEIFTGEDQRCRKWPLGLLNCCTDSGLILDVLNICNETEHRLRDAVQAEVTHYVGTYCSAPALFVCLETKRVHCTFNSKFGRIVHQQGRPQLGIKWRFDGEADEPNCRGLTPEEIEAIDFEKVDLSELYDDMIQKIEVPDYNALSDRMQEDVASFTEGGIRPDPDGNDVEGAGGEVAEIDYDRRNRQCAVGEDGTIVEERKVAVDPYGARTPLDDWKVVSNSCLPIQYEERTVACGGDWMGDVLETMPYTIDADGVRTNLGPWELEEDRCWKDDVEERTRQCEAPKEGSFTEERPIRVWRAAADEVLGDWTRTGGGCFTLETESRPLACPDTFDGERTEERTYRRWEDGTASDYSSWILATDSCSKTIAEDRPASCDAGWLGDRTESRTYDLLPDGSRVNYTPWEESANGCYKLATEDRTVACWAEYDGVHEQSRSYHDNQVGDPSNYSAWETVSNTCYRSGQDLRDAACPADWTHGIIREGRNWEQYQGDAKTWTSAWFMKWQSCKKQIRETRVRYDLCGSGESGAVYQERFWWRYRDGRPDELISGWATYQNNCVQVQ